jgi:hypothetical protein
LVVGVRHRDSVPRPVDELDVVLAVAECDRALAREAEVLGEEVEAGRLRDLG